MQNPQQPSSPQGKTGDIQVGGGRSMYPIRGHPVARPLALALDQGRGILIFALRAPILVWCNHCIVLQAPDSSDYSTARL